MSGCKFRDSLERRCKDKPVYMNFCQEHIESYYLIEQRKRDKLCIYNRLRHPNKFECGNKTNRIYVYCDNCYHHIKQFNRGVDYRKNNRNKNTNKQKVRYNPYDHKSEIQIKSIDKELEEYDKLLLTEQKKSDIVSIPPVSEVSEVSKVSGISKVYGISDDTVKAMNFLNTVQSEYEDKKRLYDEYQMLAYKITQINYDIMNLENLQLEVKELNEKKDKLEELMKSELSKKVNKS